MTEFILACLGLLLLFALVLLFPLRRDARRGDTSESNREWYGVRQRELAAETGGEITTTLVARLTALVLLGALIIATRKPAYPGTRALVPLGAMGLLDGVALLSVISAAGLPNPEFAAHFDEPDVAPAAAA